VKFATTAAERVAILVASLALSIGLIGLLSGFFAGRDPAGVAGAAATVGLKFRDLGHAHLQPGELRAPYDSDPPTSGAHVPEPVLHGVGPLNNDQLLQALEVGDVVLVYGTSHPPAALKTLANNVGGSFSPALAAAGQAVILTPRPGTQGVTALAWTRMLRVRSAQDPLLAQFAQELLGRGASSSGR
jgi:hypothetical protein